MVIKLKKILYVGVIVATFFFVSSIFLSTIITNLYYEKNELTSNSTNDKIKLQIYEYVKMFDKNIMESLQVYENVSETFSDAQVIDIAIKYIISNRGQFEDKIQYFNDEYKYEEKGTLYYSIGYVDKDFLNSIIAKLFDISDIDIEKTIYFDDEKKIIPLIMIYGDASHIEKDEIVEFEEIDYYNYTLTIKYYTSSDLCFKVKYYIKRDKFNDYGTYSLLGVTLN